MHDPGRWGDDFDSTIVNLLDAHIAKPRATNCEDATRNTRYQLRWGTTDKIRDIMVIDRLQGHTIEIDYPGIKAEAE